MGGFLVNAVFFALMSDINEYFYSVAVFFLGIVVCRIKKRDKKNATLADGETNAML